MERRVRPPKVYTLVTKSEEVTDEIKKLAEEVYDGQDSETIGSDFFDRLDGSKLEDGTYLDLGVFSHSKAMIQIRTHLRETYA